MVSLKSSSWPKYTQCGTILQKKNLVLLSNFFRSSSMLFIRLLQVFSVTPFKIDQNKKSKSFNRLSPESGNRKKVHTQRLSPRFRSQQYFSWKICEETFSQIYRDLHTLVPEAFLYSLLANFVTRTSSFNFFYWHEALRAEKRKPLVWTVGNLTFMPSAFDRRF